MKLAEYTAEWTENVLSLKKPATISSMRSHIRKINGELGELALKELSEGLIQKHISCISKGLSPRATRNYWGTFRLILSRARKEGLIPYVPDPELPKGGAMPQICFMADELQTLSRRNLMWFFFAETGMRAGEAFGLEIPNIDWGNRAISVKQSVFEGKTQEPKSFNSYRTLCLSTVLTSELRNYLGDRKAGFLFETSRGTPQRINWVLQKLHADLRELTYPETGFHAFRRGNATLLSELGAPVKIISARQGRSTGDLTVDTYINHAKYSDREWAEKLGEYLLLRQD